MVLSKLCDALSYHLDDIYTRVGNKLYRPIVGISMGTNCAPLIADFIKAFNSISRYLDTLLNIDNPYFEGMVNQIYLPELQLYKANTSYTEPPPPPPLFGFASMYF